MNKRIILNIMIIALLTFYMIFNIVYTRFINKHESEPVAEVDVWQQPFLVPESWQLKRLEMAGIVLQASDNNSWSAKDDRVDASTATLIAGAWQQLAASNINHYQQLPLEGITILAFVAEDSQPLVFRVIEQTDEIQFYRMIDQKQFNFPVASKRQLLAE